VRLTGQAVSPVERVDGRERARPSIFEHAPSDASFSQARKDKGRQIVRVHIAVEGWERDEPASASVCRPKASESIEVGTCCCCCGRSSSVAANAAVDHRPA
jgi:hypothetical protein